MVSTKKNLRTCKNGHQYYKSTDCPSCPVCEEAKKPKDGFLFTLSAPARRALETQGVTTENQLSKWSEKELLTLHGFGPGSIPKLKAALQAKGLSFKKD